MGPRAPGIHASSCFTSWRRGLAALLCALPAFALAGCTLGPDYARPPVVSPEGWRDAAAADPNTLANTPWWELLSDPQLQEMIRAALIANKDLAIATERIAETRARLGFVKADLWPAIDIEGKAGVIDPSGEITDLTGGDADKVDFYALAGTVSWEIDIFGRIRRATEAQRALLLAAEETHRAVVISLVAEVARVYVELRDADRRLEIARRTLESRAEYVKMAKLRFEGGVTSEVDWRQAEAELHRTESFVQQFELVARQKENEMSVLLGRNPGAITRGTPVQETIIPPHIPSGLPSSLLDRRPDILAAEQQLVASNANIGEAKALLFPRIALTGDYGVQSLDSGTLFTGGAKSFSLIGGLIQPIFNAGKNRRRVEVTESVMRQTLYGYEKTILNAFREVEDALIGYGKLGEQRASQGSRVEAERKVLQLAEVRYRGGVTDYLEVLDAQRSLFSAELDEVQAITGQLVSLIRLYKALGGGWPSVGAAPADAVTVQQPIPGS